MYRIIYDHELKNILTCSNPSLIAYSAAAAGLDVIFLEACLDGWVVSPGLGIPRSTPKHSH